ncbi:DUF1444 family protein [Verrucomicrobiota bacterium sgz303538]
MDRRAFTLTIPLLIGAIVVFRSFFKDRSASDAENFRERVLELVRVLYPNVSFEAPTQEADVIVANGIQIGLQNLKAKFDQSDRSRQTFDVLVAEHFQFVLQAEPSVPDFATARQKLRPQIMPPDYARQASIISFPFGQTLAIGIVLDSDKGYLYLKHEDVLRWNKSEKELLDIATANLNEASRNMQMQSSDSEEAKWIAIETKDGFDAARILIPKLREFLADRLGKPFCFAVPNRDFLFCWNTGASVRFSDFAASKIQKDFQSQPYPLSPHVFEVAADGAIAERA